MCWPVRVRSIARKRVDGWCETCQRPIGPGDACSEVSYFEEGRVWSEYRCCGRVPRVSKSRFVVPINPEEFP